MRLTATLVCLLALALIGGCAQRTLTITSEPSGALVDLNGDEIGRTPLKYDFEWYGDYDVILRKEGYATLKTHQKLKAPLWGIPPFDLFGEMFGHKDRREWTFEMTPERPGPVDAETLIARGAALRGELKSSKYTRQPSTLPTTQPAQ